MAPLLIDTNGILKLGVATAIVAVVIFVGGFYLGYQQADTHNIALSNNHSLSVSKKVISDVETRRSEKIEESDVVAVNQTEPVNKLVKELVIKTPDKTAPIKREEIQAPVSKKQQSSKEAPSDAPSKSQKANVELTADDIMAKKKYSIQVGFYGRLDNAKKRVDELKQENLNAYVSDYVNKNNEVRFNVRFGYFVDRSSANKALKAFNKNHKSDGYLVNYAGDKLTHSKEKSDSSEVNAASKVYSNAGSQEEVTSGAADVSKESAPMVESKIQNKNSEDASVPEIEKAVNR
jgi:cell division septation protein DedD